MSNAAINQTITLSKAQLQAAATQAVLAQLGIDPSTPGLTSSVRFVEELDVPPTVNYPKAVVSVAAPSS